MASWPWVVGIRVPSGLDRFLEGGFNRSNWHPYLSVEKRSIMIGGTSLGYLIADVLPLPLFFAYNTG